MTTFEVIKHIRINEEFQGFSLCEFIYDSNENINNDQIAEKFIHSKYFSLDSLNEAAKNNTEDKFYLRSLFDIDEIEIRDFKNLNKSETVSFLIDFLNQPDWGDDRNEFSKLLDKYFEIHNQLDNADFYIIRKDWYEEDDKRMIKPESFIYLYYFLILYIDRNSKTLLLTVWSYD